MKKSTLIVILFGILFQNPASSKVWINEFMQSNIDCVRDDLQEFPDSWIELYNDSDSEVNIQNWIISIDADYRNGWKISDSVVIAPKSYLLIYADEAATGIHADFRIDSGSGGALYLFDSTGKQSDAVTNIPKQPAPNIAWGRIEDGNATWAYFVSATPLSANSGKVSKTLLPPPVFSQKGGVFKNFVTVSLSLPSNAPSDVALSDIHYTFDNSEPTENSPVYSGEIKITETTVLRAKVIHPDYLTNRSTVQSYIKTSKDFTLPVISISTDSSYLWDDEFGIYCQGNGKYGLVNCDTLANWNNDWRRPINFEFFPSGSDSSVLNQLCEMRISGGCSRNNPQKSLIVYANKRFGVKRFVYDLFKDKPGQEIKSFMIRNSGNDFWHTHFRDAVIQLFMGGKVNIDYQAYQPALFYLNGVFWGIQNLRERSDEDFVLANYATENIDMVENWNGDLKAGDKTAWNELMNELRKTPSDQRNYRWITDQIDIDEFLNYMILQIYVSNTDFPGNNMVMWRPREENGKWRFILKDTDFGLGLWDLNPVTHNALVYNTEKDDDSRKLFNALLTQDSIRKEFYRRFAVYMGDLLHYRSTLQLIDSIQNLIEPYMPDHLARWEPDMGWGDMVWWYGELSVMKNWCEGRNAIVYKQLQDFFQLGEIMQLTYEPSSDLTENPSVTINGVRMRDSLDASYFQKDTLQLHYDGDLPLYGWEITQTVNETTTVDTYFQNDLSLYIPEGCISLKIKLTDNPTSIPILAKSEIKLSVFGNRLQISNLRFSTVVSIYDITGKLVTKTATVGQSVIIPIDRKGVFVVKAQNEAQSFTRKIVL